MAKHATRLRRTDKEVSEEDWDKIIRLFQSLRGRENELRLMQALRAKGNPVLPSPVVCEILKRRQFLDGDNQAINRHLKEAGISCHFLAVYPEKQPGRKGRLWILRGFKMFVMKDQAFWPEAHHLDLQHD